MDNIWGKGLNPANGIVKFSGFTWLKFVDPMLTRTGTVTVVLAD